MNISLHGAKFDLAALVLGLWATSRLHSGEIPSPICLASVLDAENYNEIMMSCFFVKQDRLKEISSKQSLS